MKLYSFILAATLIFGIHACQSNGTLNLINDDNLDNWDIYIPSGDVNPGEVFWVEDGVINTSGIPNGYIRTKESYSNFKLFVEWRWIAEPKNSGVLLHVKGEDRLWPMCVECQLKHGSAGDLVLMGRGTGIAVEDSTFLVPPEGKASMVVPKFAESSENPGGEWNQYEIISNNGSLEVRVNGILQNQGTGMTLTEGNIAIQSEGGPMQFRKISLTPIE